MSWTTEIMVDRDAWGYCVEQGPARGSVRGRGQGGGGLRGGRVSQQVHVGDDYYQAVPRFGDVTDGMRNLSFAVCSSVPVNERDGQRPKPSGRLSILSAGPIFYAVKLKLFWSFVALINSVVCTLRGPPTFCFRKREGTN